MDKIRLHSFCAHNSIDLSKLDKTYEFVSKLLISLTKSYVGADILLTRMMCHKHFMDNWDLVYPEYNDLCLSEKGRALIFEYFYLSFYASVENYGEIEYRFKRGEDTLRLIFDKKEYFTPNKLPDLKYIYNTIYE